MNTRTLLVIGVVAVLVVSGGYIFLTDSGGNSSPPFTVNDTPPQTTQKQATELNGVTDGNLQPDAANYHTLAVAQETAKITYEIHGTTNSTYQVNYTPNTVNTKYFTENTIQRESFHTIRFNATRKYTSENETIASLNPPTESISTYLHEDTLKQVFSGVKFTQTSSSESKSTQYFTFTGSTIDDADKLKKAFDVDSVVRITNAEVTISENNIITDASITAVVEEDGDRYSKTIISTVDVETTVTSQQPDWVSEELSTNAGISAQALSNSQLVLQHNYGRTISSGDTVEIRTPSGSEYTAKFTSSFSVGDRAVVALQGNEYIVRVNPESEVSSGPFLEESGRYIITIQTDDSGVVSLTAVTR